MRCLHTGCTWCTVVSSVVHTRYCEHHGVTAGTQCGMDQQLWALLRTLPLIATAPVLFPLSYRRHCEEKKLKGSCPLYISLLLCHKKLCLLRECHTYAGHAEPLVTRHFRTTAQDWANQRPSAVFQWNIFGKTCSLNFFFSAVNKIQLLPNTCLTIFFTQISCLLVWIFTASNDKNLNGEFFPH